VRHPEHPAFQDFGDVLLHGDGGSGYMRLDWFTPDGLATWGDGRLTVLGTDGYIEIRKYVDIGGGAGGNHLFIADQKACGTSIAAAVSFPLEHSSSTTCSIAPRQQCHRRTVFLRPNWRSRRKHRRNTSRKRG
jgi:hypothetical protein